MVFDGRSAIFLDSPFRRDLRCYAEHKKGRRVYSFRARICLLARFRCFQAGLQAVSV